MKFVLIPGAGGSAFIWHRVVSRLQRADHEAVALELPADDPDAGLDAYAERVLAEIGGRKDVILAAQSLGGFTVPLVARRAVPRAIVFVNAMIPLPGETASDWWKHTGSEEARVTQASSHGYSTELELETYFLHDVPETLLGKLRQQDRKDEAPKAFAQPCAFERWPEVPIHVVVGRDDRLFPSDFQIRVAEQRLSVKPTVIPGGHLVPLTNPDDVTRVLLESVPF